MAIALGYEDASDAARLACDPIHKLLVDRDPLDGEDLASQPTLSRFENAPDRKELLRMTETLADRVIERHRKRLHGPYQKLSWPTIKRSVPDTLPVASRVKCRAAGVLHRKLDFASQMGIRLVLHSHASVWKPASIRQLCACRGDAGRQLDEFLRPDPLLAVESDD